jgi:hypothetical protein
MHQPQMNFANAVQGPQIRWQLPQGFDFQKLGQAKDQNERRALVGNFLFPFIKDQVNETHASKITGMIIDETVVDIQKLLTDVQYFNKMLFGALAAAQQPQQPAARQ